MNLLYMFLFFILYSFLGYTLEMIFCLITDKKLVNRGYLLGPICPIYGLASIFIVIFLMSFKNNPIIVFILSMIICSFLEYVTGYILEKVFNENKWWNYSEMKFNLHGRINLIYSICFGLFGLIIIYFINPVFYHFLVIYEKYLSVICFIIICLFSLDFILSTCLNLKKKKTSYDKAYLSFKRHVNKVKNYKVINSNSSFYPAEFLNLINPVITNPIYIEMTKKFHHMDQTIYEHSIKVAYQVYKISKFLNLEPRNSVISALLHDFYKNSWIEDTSTKPFFQKHGFVHAKEALDNSKLYFNYLLNERIENAILRHMFPLNIIPPRYIEGWILTISDKIVSIKDIKKPVFILNLLGFNSKGY
ncbi:MAG: HD domain-containing protein [Bacilli bacterium]